MIFDDFSHVRRTLCTISPIKHYSKLQTQSYPKTLLINLTHGLSLLESLKLPSSLLHLRKSHTIRIHISSRGSHKFLPHIRPIRAIGYMV
jgi:hypothetical protein